MKGPGKHGSGKKVPVRNGPGENCPESGSTHFSSFLIVIIISLYFSSPLRVAGHSSCSCLLPKKEMKWRSAGKSHTIWHVPFTKWKARSMRYFVSRLVARRYETTSGRSRTGTIQRHGAGGLEAFPATVTHKYERMINVSRSERSTVILKMPKLALAPLPRRESSRHTPNCNIVCGI